MPKTQSPTLEYLRGCQVTPTTGCQVTPTLGFAMVLNEITCDPRLEHLDVRVYNFMAGSRRGSFVTVGGRRIASSIHADRRNVRTSIERLMATGWAEIIPGRKPGHRARYRLTDPRFGTAHKVSIAESSHKSGRKTGSSAPPVLCKKCAQPCQRLPMSGICRACVNDQKLTNKIDNRLDERGVPKRPTFDEIADDEKVAS